MKVLKVAQRIAVEGTSLVFALLFGMLIWMMVASANESVWDNYMASHKRSS